MKINSLFFKTAKLIFNNIPFAKIIPFFAVSVISYDFAGIKGLVIGLISLLILLTTRILISTYFLNNYKINYKLNYFSYVKLILMLIVIVLVSVCCLLNKQSFLYSVSMGIALGSFVDVLPKCYCGMVAFLFNKGYKVTKNSSIDSFFAFKDVDSIIIPSEMFLKEKNTVAAISNYYTFIDFKNKSTYNDYTVKILKEFSALMYPDNKCFSFMNNVNEGIYDEVSRISDGLDYTILTKNGKSRVIVAGTYENLISKCSECAELEDCSLIDDEHKIKLLESVNIIRDKGYNDISFAFCDLDYKITNPTNLEDFIFVGTLGIENSLDETSKDLICDIKNSKLSYIINYKENEKENLISVLNQFNITNIETNDNEIIIKGNDCSHTASFTGNKLVYNEHILDCNNYNFTKILKKVKTITDIAKRYRRMNILIGLSVIAIYLVLSSIVPNSAIQPYSAVFISAIIELLTFCILKSSTLTKNKHIENIISVIVFTISGILVFLAGRFFVEVPASKFDAIAVNTARTMLFMYLIMLPVIIDSVMVFSRYKSYKKNFIFILIGLLLCLIAEIPFVRDSFGFVAISFSAVKFILFFTLIPALFQGVRHIISRK